MTEKLANTAKTKHSVKKGVSRRKALGIVGGATGALLASTRLAAPQVRKKVKLTYWNWADNPNHQKIPTLLSGTVVPAQEKPDCAQLVG